MLVGGVEVGAYLGVPGFKPLGLYDAVTGARIWEAERRDLPRGEYTLLATRPSILLAGRDASVLLLAAIDPDTGAPRWQREVARPLAYLPAASGDRMMVVASDGSGGRLEGIDLGSGERLFEQRLPVGALSGGRPPALLPDGDAAILAGRALTRLRFSDGRALWTAEAPEAAGAGASVTPLPGGILVWDARSMALLDRGDGRTRWRRPVGGGGVKVTALLEDRLVRVVGGASGEAASPDATDRVESLDPGTGEVRWSRPLDGVVVSVVAADRGLVLLTVEDAIVGLDAASGRVRFREALPETFALASPTAYLTPGQPDLLHLRAGRLYVSREPAGVAAYALPEGRRLWHQDAYMLRPTAYTYSAPARTGRLTATLAMHKVDAPPPSSGAAFFEAAQPNPFIQLSQWRYDNLESVRRAAVADRDFSRAAFASGLQGVELQMQAFHAQMAASYAILDAGVSLSGAVERALRQTALQGVVSRVTMEIANTRRLHDRAFQGRYYVRPFVESEEDRAHGVTLVDLDTGRRYDLVVSPFIPVVSSFGVELPQVTVDPTGQRFYTVGVGLRPERYEAYVLWKHRMPRPSVLAYDLASLDFVDRNPVLDRRLGPDAVAAHSLSEACGLAKLGRVRALRRLLDRGVDPNGRFGGDPGGMTPIMFAATGGQAEAVRLLLARGADVRIATASGLTVLDMASDPETRGVLIEAGAKPRATR